jgi:tetratricopeptide (TPR) repeat protein
MSRLELPLLARKLHATGQTLLRAELDLWLRDKNGILKLAPFLVNLSPDGQRLASASFDGTVILWESIFEPASWEQRRQVWREQQARFSEQAGEFFAAAFHYLCLADTSAEAGQWKDADAYLAKSIKFAPTGTAAWSRRALILLQQGDKDAHAAILQQALERFGKTDNSMLANDIAWMSAVQPCKGDAVTQAVELADKALKLSPNNPAYLTTLGAALYRAGKFDMSAERLHEAQTALGIEGNPRRCCSLP